MTPIELLAPARDAEAGFAAIDHGADAVYIGAPAFGARAAATNSVADIARLVSYARTFGVRVYATLNTLLWESELADAQRVGRELIAAGIDALIVQDMAWLRMGMQEFAAPFGGVELHASTQMHNVTPARVKFLQECGFSRVILERGLTLEQIAAIRAATAVDLEAFVHGALCVGYSGRCYLSRSTGERSGNRGDCAQPCRQTYDLVGADGRNVLSSKYLLSLRDLNLSQHLAALIGAGVTSLKIEGRLKEASYVKNIVAFYRRKLDEIGITRPSTGTCEIDFAPDPARSFSRGFTPYYIAGAARGAANFDTPKALGEEIGMVQNVDNQSFTIDTSVRLSAGDGICFIGAHGALQGVNIHRVEGTRVFPDRMEGIVAGTKIYRNRDQRFEAALRASRLRRLLDVSAQVAIDEKHITLTINQISVSIDNHFEPARQPEQARVSIEAAMRKRGEMPFRVTELRVECAGSMPFIPLATLNELRRRVMMALLEALQKRTPERKIALENPATRLPEAEIGAEENVVNSLAERFYRDHGATTIAPGRDLLPAMRGQEVMRTPYCLRREIGECLKEGSTLKEPLILRRGSRDYALEFDCKNCEMKLISR